MLLEISLDNFALIKHLNLSFASGLTVVTGESGAGKSLLIQAIKIIMGAKALPQYIRTGEEQAMVQAIFDMPDEYGPVLEKYGIPEDDVLIIRRSFSINGRTRNYINGAMVNLQTLKEIAAPLASLAGQHEYQGLLKSANHCIWLDHFGGLEQDVLQVSERYHMLQSARKALDKILEEKNAAKETLSKFERELKEITSIEPVAGEDEALEQEYKILKEAAHLMALGESCFEELYAQKGSLLEGLARCRTYIERMSAIDPRLSKTGQDIASVIYQTEEIASSLRDYLKNLHVNTSRLNEVEERLHRLKELKRRFGPELSDVISYKEMIKKKLNDTKNQDELINDLKKEILKREKDLMLSALRLSEMRKDAAARLSKTIEAGLKELNFLQATFAVHLKTPNSLTAEDIGPRGMDEVRFLFSPNIGEPLRFLSDIASGGELSRVMLVLRTALAGESGIETIIFDEIDAGLDGETAERVGRKLKTLATMGQVIAVTHFPQIAAFADQHVVVTKTVEEDRTLTKINRLSDTGRLDELARMLGGDRTAAKNYAKELLQS
ncbi:MAG: DNA repair protein RecN [Dissulfurimicrobium sp.]|uniref:DNA repair protein RecN n=1 Tax=Dissulfurimicrobium sp. TaxID=2022436 RepID=UPI00404AA34F